MGMKMALAWHCRNQYVSPRIFGMVSSGGITIQVPVVLVDSLNARCWSPLKFPLNVSMPRGAEEGPYSILQLQVELPPFHHVSILLAGVHTYDLEPGTCNRSNQASYRCFQVVNFKLSLRTFAMFICDVRLRWQG